MVEVGLMLFLIFIGVSLLVAARAALKSQKKQKVKKQRYRPYQPQATQTQTAQASAPRQATITQTQSESRAAYASADEYFRAGMYDRAKEEYLKTGRVFGAAKSIAAKGREFIPDSLQIISRYAPERDEEMVRNLSRYFFDSGETELSALILYESELIEEADAVLATIGKTIDDITPTGVVEVSAIDPSPEVAEDTQKSLEELEEIASKAKEEVVEEPEPKIEIRTKGPQPLKVATTDLDERCSVCMSPIKAGESFVRCPFCDTPSHYSHIVEWIKVKPQCPNCRKKLVARMFQA